MTELFDGADTVIAALGRWPTFHDAEVLALFLRRVTTVDGFADILEVVSGKVVRFRFAGLREWGLSGFNEQNVISELTAEAVEGDLVAVKFWPCYGVSGRVVCGRVEVSMVSRDPAPG
ncbi:MAG: Imm50 family immunity protein [Bryobacteraceae bacterium]